MFQYGLIGNLTFFIYLFIFSAKTCFQTLEVCYKLVVLVNCLWGLIYKSCCFHGYETIYYGVAPFLRIQSSFPTRLYCV
jgi:hypothetical protein